MTEAGDSWIVNSGPGVPVLSGRRVRLRAPRVGDVGDRIAHGRHAEIVRMYGGEIAALAPSVSVEEARRWAHELGSHPHAWVIEDQERCVGQIRLDNVDMTDQRASLAVGLLHPDLLGRGLGTDAIITVVDYAFGRLGLHRVGVRVLDYNRRAIKAYQKAGFVHEGRERESCRVGDRWHDDVIMGVVRSDPRPSYLA